MPIETRQIVFNRDELFQAIDSYRRMHQQRLPPGDVLEFDFVGEDALQIVVATPYGKAGTEIAVDLNPDEVVDLLVRFCSENNIHLPRQGDRSARVVSQRMVLLVRIAH